MMNPRTGPVRRAAVAGYFYPSDPGELRSFVEALLLNVPESRGPGPKALIVPHAGYIYSAPIAASAYACLKADRKSIKRVVLIGPSHFVAVKGLAASSAESFATPLGLVRVDREAVKRLTEMPQVRINDEAHAREHSLEVQLPFLQVLLEDFQVVPLVAGEVTVDEVAGAMDAVWGGNETRLVISSDLSHYLDSEAARKLDCATAAAIERLDASGIAEQQACGRVPICGLLRAASSHRLTSQTADLRNSGDTAGPRDQVVGYGAFVFRPPDAASAASMA